jgi:hypothetical protein
MTTTDQRNLPPHFAWMARTPQLESLRIDELILPGSHNAGSDKQSPNLGVPQEYAQDVAPLEQLRQGIRVLDLRVTFHPSHTEGSPRRFQLYHLTSSGRTVAVDILQRVNEYYEALERNGEAAREIVVLDFHQFDTFTQAAHEELQLMIIDRLGSRLLPHALRGLTLERIWHDHPGKNVVIAYNHGYASLDFWEGVKQRWPGKNLFNTNTLKTFVDQVAGEIKPDHALHAVQCAKYSLPFHAPTDLSDKVDQWFESVDANSYIQNFYIINTDWSLRSRIIANCRHACEIRANHRLTHPEVHLQPARR